MARLKGWDGPCWKKERLQLQSERRPRTFWDTVAEAQDGYLLFLRVSLFLSMYLPRTWRGEAKLVEYYKTLKEIDKNLHEVK